MLLGFDAREMWLDYHRTWPQERRNTYLLREDITKPLSTDPIVWPSILSVEDRQQIPSYREPLGLVTDLEKLHEYLKRRDDRLRQPYWIIALTVALSRVRQQDRRFWQAFSINVNPSSPAKRWMLLGYDVSDMSFLSSLTNCGYAQPLEHEHLRRQFGQLLNKHHLLTTLDSAWEFKVLSDSRVTEHAPFFVYGLYLTEVVGVAARADNS